MAFLVSEFGFRTYTGFAMSAYKSYKDLPSLAGVCSMEDAMNPGLSVEECVRRLKRYHYHQISLPLNSRLTFASLPPILSGTRLK